MAPHSWIVCACKDFTTDGSRLYGFCSIKNTIIDSEHNGTGTELDDILETIEKQQFVNPTELLGLKWTDIDWNNGIIKVRRQVARVDGQIVEAPLKTKNSYRTVTISQQAIEVLKQQKEKTNDEYVFPVAVPGRNFA